MKLTSYYDAIKFIKEKQNQAKSLRETCDKEIDRFEKIMERTIPLGQKIDRAKYLGTEASVESKRKEFNQKIEVFSPAQLCDFIQSIINTVEQLLIENGRYHATAAENQTEQSKLIYYCTYLYVIGTYFAKKIDASGKQNYHVFIENIRCSYSKQQEQLYNETYSEIKEFLSQSSSFAKGNIAEISDAVVMPNDFSKNDRIDIGYYVGQQQNWIEQASQLLDGDTFELEYKKLIYAIASANRKHSILAMDISSSTESNNIAIHQQSYSLREIDYRQQVKDDHTLIELLESVMCRYITTLPRISKRICIIQNRELSELEAFTNNIYRKANELIFTDVSKDGILGFQSVEDTLKALLAECRSCKEILIPPCKNIFEFNKSNYSDGVWKQMTLLVIKDYPLGFDSKSVELLNYILQDANKYGIHVIMSVCDDLLLAAKKQIRDVDFESVFEYFDQNNCFNIDKYNLVSRYSYECVSFENTTLRYDEFDMQSYLSNLERYISNSKDPAIPLMSLFDDKSHGDDTERRKNFFRVLDFPIGKVGTTNCNMKLYQSGGGSPHVVIAGTTGSGKSVLLQDIILSAACHYSPEELELYLFDFKETPKGFDRYKVGFPHVRKIATQCKERDIFELLSMIQRIYTKRMKIAGGLGFTDIGRYNAYAKEKGLEQFPRIMVVIDEYQTIQSEKCLELLLEIAQKGREFGVVLVMASQSNSVQSFSRILKLFGHRFEFKNEPLGGLINRIGTRAQELNGPKGLCFYSSDGSAGLPTLLRCAFVNDDDSNEAIKLYSEFISNKFAGYKKMPTYKVGDTTQICRSIDFNFEDVTFTSLETFADKEKSVSLLDGEIETEKEWLNTAETKFNNYSNLKDRGFLLRLGLNSLSLNSLDVKIDRSNPYLMLCGDIQRIRSLEYSIIRSVVMPSNSTTDTLMYYIEGDKKYDANTPPRAIANHVPNVKFISPTLSSIDVAVSNIYEEYTRRKRATSDSDYKPMLVLFSSFDALLSLIEESKDGKIVSGENIDTSGISIADSLFAEGGLFYNQVKALEDERSKKNGDKAISTQPKSEKIVVSTQQHNKTKSLMDKLASLITADLYNYGIFLAIHISDASCCSYFKKKFNSSKTLSLVYLSKENVMEIERDEMISQMTGFVTALTDMRLPKLKKEDICTTYGYKFTTSEMIEFIPYEFNTSSSERS